MSVRPRSSEFHVLSTLAGSTRRSCCCRNDIAPSAPTPTTTSCYANGRPRLHRHMRPLANNAEYIDRRQVLAYLSTVIIRSLSPYSHTFIIGIPSPTHSFTLGLNPSFSANPPCRSLSFVSFKIHYMDFPDCLLLLLSISVFLLFSFFFCFYTFLVVGSVR